MRCPGIPTRRRAGEVVDEATVMVTSIDDSGPFFAWVHLFDTHRPYDLPTGYKDRYFDPYLAAIRVRGFPDRAAHRSPGISPLTGRHISSSSSAIMANLSGITAKKSHGIFVYQEALRVPFIMRGSGSACQPSRRRFSPARRRHADRAGVYLALTGVRH